MATLDTNCLLRWLIRDDPPATAQVDARVAAGTSLRVPDAVLIEAVYVMERHYVFTRDEVALAIRLVLGQAVFTLDRAVWADVMDAYLTHPKLSVTDIFLAVDAASHDGAPLISLDRKLISQLGAVAP